MSKIEIPKIRGGLTIIEEGLNSVLSEHNIAITDVIYEVKKKKEQCLIHIVRELLGVPINAETGKRIHCMILLSGRVSHEQYIWDLGKKTEILLMDWQMVLYPLDIWNIDFVPAIKVSAPVSVDIYL